MMEFFKTTYDAYIESNGRKFLFVIGLLIFSHPAVAQHHAMKGGNANKISGYAGYVQPIASFSDGKVTSSFSNGYSMAMAFGLNIVKSSHIAYSFEVDPIIHFGPTESKVSNLLIQPGIILKERNGYSIAPRLAFETSGRFGFAFSTSKVFYRADSYNFFLLLSFPSVRFGNNAPTSVGASMALGMGF
ncbi:hypothetical protein FKX85_05765 [Echinicola soli]|uniref:Outer membrane protein beta-barrel domain-containing protein n=1 Tax=Echinicola soli TaxID=2591634 RepID=A0A514CFG3_9BACT|nr:hypothetical protein [Echinicola soli]QDH78563.1 hypothetical protein FKX85_05765 [Echinicola soli]